MALTTCPDCEHLVSDQAPACPQCGRPMTATTTERTGKQLKGWLVVFAVVLCCGLLGTCVAAVDGESPHWFWVVLLVVGVLGWFVTEVSIWWEHE